MRGDPEQGRDIKMKSLPAQGRQFLQDKQFQHMTGKRQFCILKGELVKAGALSTSLWTAEMKYRTLGILETTEIYFLQFWHLGSPSSRGQYGLFW